MRPWERNRLTLNALVKRSYYYRMAFLVGLVALLGVPITSGGLQRRSLLMISVGVMPLALTVFIILRAYRRGARLLDDKGVTRRDGKRFSWIDLGEVRRVRARLQSGELGALNHVVLLFPKGQVRIFPLILENPWEVLNFVDRIEKRKRCSICSQLADYNRGFQKFGREEEDTSLPEAAGRLKDIAEVRPGANRSPVLDQCPECGTYYLYKVEYEFLADGSEDEQILTRLTDQEAAEILASIPRSGHRPAPLALDGEG